MRRRRIRSLSLGKRGSSGSAAVEFALIAPAFFLLLFASFETGLTYFAGMTLENGVVESARLIRTGQTHNAGMSQAQFRNDLCDRVNMLLSCDAGKLYIDVRSFSNFGGSSYPPALDEDGELNPDLNSFQTGSSGAATNGSPIVLVRVFYKWQLFTPIFAQYFKNMPDNVRLISSSVAFRNEPF